MKNKKIIYLICLLLIVIVSLYIIILVLAYSTDKDNNVNSFTIGNVSIVVTEPNYTDNQVIKPNGEITKDPTFQNIGSVSAYIRAQIYVPVSKEIKYVDNLEQIVTPTEDIEIFSYTLNDGWEEVLDEGFSGTYTDDEGNIYNVHTYKYMQDSSEKIIEPNETISTPVFSKIKVINYLDTDKSINLKMLVNAIAVQTDGGTASQMWTYYINQNQTGIVREVIWKNKRHQLQKKYLLYQ